MTARRKPKDANDVLRESGPDGLREEIRPWQRSRSHTPRRGRLGAPQT